MAQLYQIAPNRLARCPLPNGDLLALQRACRAYDRWREQDVAEQNRINAIDQWAWGSLHKLVPAVAQPWMRQHWYNPWRVLTVAETHLTIAWQTFSQENADSSWIKRWLERASQMTTLYGSQQQVGYDQLQETMGHSLQLRQQYALAQARLTNEKIVPLYNQLFPDSPLTSIKGIGIQSAATYQAFIQDISRFPTVDKFRRWCGIVPRSKQSGEGEAKGMSITKSGPNLVKAALYLNAEVARQWDAQIAFIYYRLLVDYGNYHTQAVCACASHLASRIYALLKQQRPYQLRDLQGNPISEQASRELCLRIVSRRQFGNVITNAFGGL